MKCTSHTTVVLQALGVCNQLRTRSQRQAKLPGSSNYLQVGCWNVRTLEEADGDICTGMFRPGQRQLIIKWSSW